MEPLYERVFRYGRFMAHLGHGWYEDWTLHHTMHNELQMLLRDAQRPLEELLHQYNEESGDSDESGEEYNDEESGDGEEEDSTEED